MKITNLLFMCFFCPFVFSADLVVNSDLTINSSATYDNIIVNSGTLTINANVAATSVTSSSTIIVNSGKTFTVTSNMLNSGTLTVNGNVNVTGNLTNSGFTNGDGNINAGSYTNSGFFFNCAGANISACCNGSVCNNNGGALPISLLYFTAELNDNSIVFNWATASEENNHLFVVEKSYNNSDFTEVITTQGQGNSLNLMEYTTQTVLTNEDKAYAILYYRLRQIDYDGKFEVFNIAAIEIESTQDDTNIHVFPNPVSSEFKIILTDSNLAFHYTLFNIIGNKVAKGKSTTNTTIDISSVEKGVYYLEIEYQGLCYRKTILKK